MFLYMVKSGSNEHYITETESDFKVGQTYIKIKSLYQFLDIKTKGRFLVELFNKDDNKTFILKEMTGEYLFSLESISDIMIIDKLPEIKIISREMYIGMFKASQEEKQSSNLSLME